MGTIHFRFILWLPMTGQIRMLFIKFTSDGRNLCNKGSSLVSSRSIVKLFWITSLFLFFYKSLWVAFWIRPQGTQRDKVFFF